MQESVQACAQRAKVYDICVAMVRYTFVQSCHKAPLNPLQIWLQDAQGRTGKNVMRRHLVEVRRESFVTWKDPDFEWCPERIVHATRRDTVRNLNEAMRAFPLFPIHHPWLPRYEPQTTTFRKTSRGTIIHRIANYEAGSSCLRCACYKDIDARHLVTTFLEKFKPESGEEGVHKFITAMHAAAAMACPVWQPDVGAVAFNACKDRGWLTKAARYHSCTFVCFEEFPTCSKIIENMLKLSKKNTQGKCCVNR